MAKLVEFTQEGIKQVPMQKESQASPFNIAARSLYRREDIFGITLSEGADARTYFGLVEFPAQGVIPASWKILVVRFTADKKEIEFWKEL